ncbi:phage portal protein family protein [Epilithonimonas xixisoli]|uniref:Uncharacterized protein DUF935 n=1 Tax=Epilithonimonas xixisoli TaxID=1476462 RepID=A0A4R8I9K8_9FLAO|nr:DUF935 family protein [Epilithonimonas xixisoli]TDX86190.1 uncharacterized protein DUF935 [Epilithonimonas xixisoli]
MAKNTRPRPQKQPAQPTVIVQDISLVSPDRGRKDIQSLKNSVVSAESIHYPNRVLLYDLYHDVVSMDGFLRGIINKRIDSVLNKKLKFIDKEGNENTEVTKLMRSKVGRQLIRQILESIFWGISGVEFKVGEKFCFEEIQRKHIKPEKGLIAKNQYSISKEDGFKIDEMPFVWVIGEKRDLGLLLACSMYAIYKRGNFGDWAQYVEIFGQPVRIMEYDAYDTQTKEELKKILNESGNSLAMMIPKQATFQMLDGKASNGDGKLQGGFKEACNEEMAIAILGNTETTSASKSSGYAQSKEHGEQQDEITASDLIFVENELNSDHFLNILKSYGYDVEGGEFEYELDLNLSKLKIKMEIDVVVSEKVPVDDDYWYFTYGIPKPKNYDALKREMEARKNANQLPIKEEGKTEKPTKEKAEKEDLADYTNPTIIDKFFKKMADFFDHARR